jgi:sortase A
MNPRPSLLHTSLMIVGKLLISMSIGVLLFLGWTLWGTKAAAVREQRNLSAAFDKQPAFFKIEPGTQPGTEVQVPLPPDDYAPGIGKPVFRLRIPKMDLNEIVVEGVSPEQLDVAPGHYPSCRKGVARELCTPWDAPFPGEIGRVVISGHRTTHGAPFWDLNLLDEGDRLFVETKWGNFVYEVSSKRIVPEDSTRIVIESPRAEIVLTTCHPRYSADQRMVVTSRLMEAEPA